MVTPSAGGISPQQFLDASPVSTRQRWIVFVVFLVMVADGMDITIVSHMFPPLIREWGTEISTVTLIVTGSVMGMAAGALLAGGLADRFGRKPVTIGAIAVLGVGTAALGLAPSIEVLATIRIVSALGLGGVMPVVLTLVADLVPSARRAQLVTVAFAGVPLGTIIGAYLAATLIPSAGWRTFIIVAGVIPLLFIPFFAAIVPESPSYLASRGAEPSRIHAILGKLTGGTNPSSVAVGAGHVAAAGKPALGVLVSRRFLLTTLFLWSFAFLGQGVQLLIVQFLPILLQAPVPGLTTVESSLVVAMWGWGSLIGVLVLSLLLKRFDRFLVVCALLAWSLIGMLILGYVRDLAFVPLLIIVFAIGLTLPAGVGMTNTLSTLAYPALGRATGVGAANFSGRIGTLFSGLAGGAMVASGLGLGGVFLALTAPVVVAIAALLGMRASANRWGQGPAGGEETLEFTVVDSTASSKP